MSSREILEILKKYKEENKHSMKRIGIFGSCARGDANDASDIDVVVELEKPDMFALVHIKEDLEKLLDRRVDIVRKRESMNPFLKRRMEQEAVYA